MRQDFLREKEKSSGETERKERFKKVSYNPSKPKIAAAQEMY